MQRIRLGQSDLHVTPICLGTMTFGEQVDESLAHAILDRSLERGIDYIDTAEMYAVPARAATIGATELPTLASAVEQALQEQRPRATVDVALEALEASLAALVGALEDRLG